MRGYAPTALQHGCILTLILTGRTLKLALLLFHEAFIINTGISLRDQGDVRGAVYAAEEFLRLASEARDEQLATLAVTLEESGDAAAARDRAAALHSKLGVRR